MNRQTMTFIAILALVSMVSFSLWPMWQWFSFKRANAEMMEQAQKLAEKSPHLKAALKIAMQDGVLTEDEAKEIIEAAKEKVETEK